MKKIKYNTFYEYKLDALNKTKEYKYISMYCMLDKFMETNPPCKDCLVQVTCIRNSMHKAYPYPYLYIKVCNDLKKFVTNNEIFIEKFVRIT